MILVTAEVIGHDELLTLLVLQPVLEFAAHP